MRLLVLCCLLLLLAGPMAGCGPSPKAPEAPERATDASTAAAQRDTTVTDALGRAVTFAHPARRIVTLAPNLTEIAAVAGAGPRLVGVTTADDYPPALVDTLPAVSALPLDFEAVVALEPDLVLAADQVNSPRDAATLAGLDVPVYVTASASLADVFAAVETVGALAGTAARATAAADSLRRALAALRRRTAARPTRPRTLVLVGDETLYAFGRGSYVHTLVEAAGGTSVTADLPSRAPTLSEEFVIEAAPEVIVGAFGPDYDPERLARLHPAWDVVPAMRTGRVCSLDPDLLLRPGPRLVAGAQQVAACLAADAAATDAATDAASAVQQKP